MTPPDKITVTQADKERAQAVWDAFDLTCAQGVELARSLARHRIAATSDNLALMREAVETIERLLLELQQTWGADEGDDPSALNTLAKLRDEIAREEGE